LCGREYLRSQLICIPLDGGTTIEGGHDKCQGEQLG
jgi:hypothetical protein